MNLIKTLLVLSAATALAACESGHADKTTDGGLDRKHLSQLKAGIWVDPNGCDHWIIDDGVEGYLSARLDKNGKPVCSGVAPPTTAVGDFKGGATSIFGDAL